MTKSNEQGGELMYVNDIELILEAIHYILNDE